MRTKNRFFLFLIGMMAFAALIISHPAHAQSTSNSASSSNASNCFKALQTNIQSTAQAKSAAAVQVITGLPQIDAAASTCLAKFSQVFSVVLSSTNPLDIIKNVVVQAVQKAVAQLINSACTAALSAVNQVIQSATSLLNLACLPIPDFNLNGSASINLNLPKVNCNGVSLLSAQISPATMPAQTPAQFNPWNIWQRPY